MKIDRKKIVNRCGYDQNECMLLAKKLSECPDDTLISELKQVTVWNYGKCELGLWANVLDRLDVILESAVTRVGKWMLRLDLPENASLVDDVVTILEFTGHLIEHSIYRYLYGSWNHILALFGSENMDILLAVLGLSYNFSKRSNYFVRLDPHNKKMVLDRLVSIAETWGGAENNFGLAACCNPNHFPETAGNIYFEYRQDPGDHAPNETVIQEAATADPSHVAWSSSRKIILQALHRKNQSPSQIMEELLSQHPVPSTKQMALFARVRLATYFANPEQRHKCIRARLQALSILSYTFEVDERHLYPSLLDELVEVLELTGEEYTGIKACALRTMTAVVNSHRLGVNWASLVGCTGLSSYHGILPNLTRRWIQGLVDGTIEAPGGSTNQQFTTALLSFLYHLACYEESVGPGNVQSATLSTSGVLDTMLQLIAWHTSRNDCLSYVTRAVRVTDQILMSISVSRQNVVNILVERLSYEVELVIKSTTDMKETPDYTPALNTQRSGLMKSILNLLKRLCLDTEWNEVMHSVMDSTLPDILRRIFLNGSSHFTPHLALFAMETVTNYLYTYPSRISAMQDKNVTTDILTALTSQPLPQNRDFLVQLPGLFNTLALNARGIDAIQSSGVLTQYLETLVSPEYLTTMKTKRVRDFLSQISYNLTSSTGQSLSNSLTAGQMSNAIQELLRSHSELKPTVFQSLVGCLRRVVEMGKKHPASLIVETAFPVAGPSSGDTAARTVASSETPACQHLNADLPCLSGVALGHFVEGSRAAASGETVTDATESAVMLEDDVVMLFGGEDEDDDDDNDNDIDDVSRATQTAATISRQARTINPRVMDSRSASPAPSLQLKDTGAQSATSRPGTSLADGSPAPPHLFLSDFMLNTCKFLEKLLPSVLHVTEAMCRHFVSHGGLQVLCDLLRMPGLPYDFPISAACVSLCKIFEDLANAIYLNDVIEPLFQCLEASLAKLTALHTSQFSMTSLLLREYMVNEHTLLHELVVTASIICIIVQIIDHLKPELRPSLANKWIGQNMLDTLGQLYLGVSWEAGILLKLLFGDKDITEADIDTQSKKCSSESQEPSSSSTFGGRTMTSESQSKKPGVHSSPSWKPVTETSPMPQFVEALHVYTLLKQTISQSGDNSNAFLHKRPDLVKPTHRILHVTAFLLNSVTELCTAWGRFFANRNQLNYRRRRMTLLPSEQIPSATKCTAFSQISRVLSGNLAWEASIPAQHHRSSPGLIYAMRYAAIRLTRALLHESSQKGPQSVLMNAFFTVNGVRLYFHLFRELINFDLTDPTVREILKEVLEEWLVCADRISNVEHINNELGRSSDLESQIVDADTYVDHVYQNMLFPLEQLCTRSDLQGLLTQRAVEHLLSMLVTIVPYLFNTTGKTKSCETESSKVVASITHKPSGNVLSTPPTPQDTGDVDQVTPSFPPRMLSLGITDFPPIDLPVDTRPDWPIPTPIISELPYEPVLDSNAVFSGPQPMDTSESDQGEPEQNSRASESLRLMEEMGFRRDLARVALEQTGWDTNEAVNLVIATPPEDLLTSAPSTQSNRRSHGLNTIREVLSRRNERTNPSITQSTEAGATPAASTMVSAAMQLVSAASSLISSAESVVAALEGQKSTNTVDSVPTSAIIKESPATAINLEPLSVQVINELRDSLKQHVFRACYSIARHQHSDQILHRIAELLLSSGEESRYIDELFGFVASSISDRLGLVATPLASTGFSTAISDRTVAEHPIVGLHLSALLFTRCQALCARLAHAHNLPQLLISWILRVEQVPGQYRYPPVHESMDMDRENIVPDASKDKSDSEYYKTLLLAFLILDQYERSIQAMRLRQLSTKQYLHSHSWNWFDDRAMLWHPYTTESGRAIDNSFHKGELCAHYHISRRPYAIEFPTMTQINLDSMHRRPALLFPTKPDDPDESYSSMLASCSPYEKNILECQIPPSLSAEQRKSLLHGILAHLDVSTAPSSRQTVSPVVRTSPIPSDCVNAMLRLLLRLAYSSYEDAQEMADANCLTILLNFPHTREFSSEYSAFVGSLLTQVFDDKTTVARVMREVFLKMCQFGIPSAFMGIGAHSSACHDLFYLLGMCAPMFAKDPETALQLACETFSLTLSDADITAKTVPKNYNVDPSIVTERLADFSLSARQLSILTQLVELILRPPVAPKVTSAFQAVEVVPVHDLQRLVTTNSTLPTQPSTLMSSANTTTFTGGLSSLTSSQHITHSGSQQTLNQSSLSSSTTTGPTATTADKNEVVILDKADAIRYLIDLVASYKPVAEFIACFKQKNAGQTEPNQASNPSFLAHLFCIQLTNPDTTELTMSLLENLVLMGCDSTQDVIISEYKTSLGRISELANFSAPSLEPSRSSSPQLLKNESLTAHMLFLERLLVLPPPLVDRLIRLSYRKHLPADIAKLIALVDCNLPNTQSTLAIMLRTLESLTWVDRQINKLVSSAQEHMRNQTTSTVGATPIGPPADLSVNTLAQPTHARTTVSTSDTHGQPPSNRYIPRTRASDITHSRDVHSFDSDSDDEDDHTNIRLIEHSRVTEANDDTQRQSSTAAAAVNLVMDDVIMAGADIVMDQDHVDQRDPDEHWRTTGEQDGSVIFVHDDEDEGSAGQGGEGDNSQDDDDVLDVEEDEDDAAADDDDDDGDEDNDDDDDDDDEDDDDDDGNDGPETDEEVIGDDGTVALVLRSGSSGRRLRGSRHPRSETTISVSVTGGRGTSEHDATVSVGEAVRGGYQRTSDDLDDHSGANDEDDGSFTQDDVVIYRRDDEARDDLTMLGSNQVFLNSEGRNLRDNNPVVSMVEEVLNLLDVPHQGNPTVVSRAVDNRRERFMFAPSQFGSLNVLPSGNSGGNWGLFLPRLGNSGNTGIHLRTSTSTSTGLPPNTTIFRFGLGNGGGTSVLVTGGNNNRFNSSAVNLSTTGTGGGIAGGSQALVPPILSSQHPLLQVPSAPSSSATPGTTPLNHAPYGPSSNNLRFNRSVVTNAGNTPFTNRVTSVLPPIPPNPNSISSMHYGHRTRVHGGLSGPGATGSSGLRQRGPLMCLYAPVSAEPISHRSFSPSTEAHLNVPSASAQAGVNMTEVRDHRAGPEADSLVWNMLSSLAEDQPLSINSALASAIFSQTDSSRSNARIPLVGMGGVTPSQLSPYAGYALPASFRRWISTASMLFGHELMDVILHSRYKVYEELSHKRHESFKRRLLEAERLANQHPANTVPSVASPLTTTSTITTDTDQRELGIAQAETTMTTLPAEPVSDLQTASTPPALVDRTLQLSVPSSPSQIVDTSVARPSDSLLEPQAGSDQSVPEPTVSESTLSATQASTQPESTVPSARPVVPTAPMTDDETIRSLVEGGMDPSFLDALPEEMRREVIADHRHARQVQQQLSSIALPEHINSDWLAGLPPHIQEEVLVQFRNEQQQQQQQQQQEQEQQNTAGATAADQPSVAVNSVVIPRTPESNTAFLLSLPTSLRREVLADMDESQLEILPQDLVTEARQLRRESEERFARAVQGGILTHSFTSRHDHDMWRNLTNGSAAIDGPGRWDVRFNSINQFLRHLNTTIGRPLGSSTALGLQNVPGIRGRHLVDHDGLTCLIALLVASSYCSQQRRHIIPTVKKVLRNLSCHSATRNWIVCTLLSLFDGLSEKVNHDGAPLTSTPALPSSSKTSTALELGTDRQLPSLSRPPSNNTIFHIGFEAALGCWVRIFHPIASAGTMDQALKVGDNSNCVSTESMLPSSSSLPDRRHVIHPQAALSVSTVLLDTLGDLAKAFPSHFYPHSMVDGKRESEPSGSNAPISQTDPVLRPSFWEVFDRLADASVSLEPTSSLHDRSNRRGHGVARKRVSSSSNKQTGELSSPFSSAVHGPSSSLAAGITPMDLSGPMSQERTTDSSSKQDSSESLPPSRTRAAAPVHSDYFVHLADLICHPLIQDRPSHQERLLVIFAGIVKDFILVRGQSTENVPSTQAVGDEGTTNQIPEVTSTDTTTPTGVPAPTEENESTIQPSSSITPTATDLIGSLRLEVIRSLCQFVCAQKSTESGRSVAAQLITDLARANHSVKDLMLQLLSESIEQLTTRLSTQLQDLVDELDSQTVKGDRPVQPAEMPTTSLSSANRNSSLEVLPDRFGGSSQVVVSGDPRPSASTAVTDLQLKSAQAFSCPNNDQSRLRGILGLIVRLAAGECSINTSDPVPVSSQDPLQYVLTLSNFWSHLSVAFEKLQSVSDPNAVLLLQPLLEAFCLAHLFVVKDTILLRQRSVATRSTRPNVVSTNAGAHSLIDMVPMLQLRVEPTSSVPNRGEANIQSTNEHTTHLHLDVMGPTSPPSVSGEDDKTQGAEETQSGLFTVSSNSPSNAIVQFAEQYRTGLNQVLRQHGGSLGESPFAVFLAYPRVLDFDIKRRFFRQQLQSLSNRSPLSNRYDDEPIVISRDRLFEDSYARLHRKSPAEWKHKFVIRFHNEEGQDAGGPLREWFLLMSREIFNPNYCLFRTSPADQVTYTINPSSYINSNHLSYFKFVGRFIAKAIYDNKLLECYFSRSFYKHILGVPVKYSDLESEDYDFFKGLEFLLNNHVSDLGYELTFSTEISEFGKTETRDLIENGGNVQVTEHNKREYVRLVCQERMTGAVRQQLDAFLAGFYEIIPKRMVSIFNEQELELLISGLPNIDIDDLKANTTYSKYQLNSPQIEWFWRALESFDQEDRARFLQFVTGTSKVPLGGFANLEGMHGPTKFQISRATVSSTSHLPCAHTCFNTLVLPAYEVYEQLRSRLLTAIRECSEGYGMA